MLPVSASFSQRVALMCDNLKTRMEMESSQDMLILSFACSSSSSLGFPLCAMPVQFWCY
jgi:hypothetical protein